VSEAQERGQAGADERVEGVVRDTHDSYTPQQPGRLSGIPCFSCG
jgi:hypothetical protein